MYELRPINRKAVAPFRRPSIHEVMLEIANILSQRATCAKLQVGCVLTDDRNRIIGSGYNGVGRGEVHCTDCACAGATAPKGADLCEAIHAEQNALLTCRDPDAIRTCYTTHAPCMRCTKMLLNTGCISIIFFHGDDVEPAARTMWRNNPLRRWYHYTVEDSTGV
jgi:dCMP deaminase